jgi:hypothetical protein
MIRVICTAFHTNIIRQETETGRLIHDFFVIADLKGSLIGKRRDGGQADDRVQPRYLLIKLTGLTG